MSYKNLREWLIEAENLKELKVIDGADWNLEIGGLVDIIYKQEKVPPAILFDNIKDYPQGYRCLFGTMSSLKRLALAVNMQGDYNNKMEFIKAYRDKMKNLELIDPKVVKESPLFENVLEGNDINILKFPSPWYHEGDGGRFFGTGHIVVTKDPDTGWINAGTYRLMVHNENTLGFYPTPGKHGDIHRQKYFEKGKPCPVAVAVGTDPALIMAATMEVEGGVSEYQYVGGLKGEPVEVINAPYTGLPVPANAEIVIEGESYPDVLVDEGPFGEWPGYYAGSRRPEPIIKIKSIMYRNNPILTCALPARPPQDHSFYRSILRSAFIWDALDKAGVEDVRGVWCHESGGSRLFNIVSIKQRHWGHAKQAGLIASQCRAGAYMGRYVVVVDEDIDPSNTDDVLWALSTRTDPVKDINIITDTWASKVDPMIPPWGKVFLTSRAIINACRPYDWIKDFPAVAETSVELKEKLLQKFKEYF